MGSNGSWKVTRGWVGLVRGQAALSSAEGLGLGKPRPTQAPVFLNDDLQVNWYISTLSGLLAVLQLSKLSEKCVSGDLRRAIVGIYEAQLPPFLHIPDCSKYCPF